MVVLLLLLGNFSTFFIAARVVAIIALLQAIAGGGTIPLLPFKIPEFIWDLPGLSVFPGNFQKFVLLGGALVVFTIISLLSELQSRRIAIRLIIRFTRYLRVKAVHHSFNLAESYYTEKKLGEINFNLFTPLIQIPVMMIRLHTAFNASLRALGSIALLFYLAPVLSLSMGLAGGILFFFMGRVHRSLMPVAEQMRSGNEFANGIMMENLTGMRIIKQAHQESRMKNRFFDAAGEADSARIRFVDLQVVTDIFTNIGGMVVILTIAGLVVFLQNIELLDDIGFALGYFMALWRVFGEIRVMVVNFTEFMQNVPYLTKLTQFLNDDSHLEKRIFGTGTKTDFQVKQALTLENISFSFEQGKEVLEDINISFPVGTATALIGLSGSGKTTLLELISRMRVPNKGRILIDGQDISLFEIGHYRKNLGYMNQDPVLFNDSIKENLRFMKPEASDDEIVRSASLAEAHDFILQTNEGYETTLGDRGILISGGQRQRIALARVLIQNPKLLLLDESTGALDLQTEAGIMRSLLERKKDRILIVATHRFTSITKFDQIVFIHGGMIVEQGSHEELMEMKGMYFNLYNFQSGSLRHGQSPDVGM